MKLVLWMSNWIDDVHRKSWQIQINRKILNRKLSVLLSTYILGGFCCWHRIVRTVFSISFFFWLLNWGGSAQGNTHSERSNRAKQHCNKSNRKKKKKQKKTNNTIHYCCTTKDVYGVCVQKSVQMEKCLLMCISLHLFVSYVGHVFHINREKLYILQLRILVCPTRQPKCVFSRCEQIAHKI